MTPGVALTFSPLGCKGRELFCALLQPILPLYPVLLFLLRLASGRIHGLAPVAGAPNAAKFSKKAERQGDTFQSFLAPTTPEALVALIAYCRGKDKKGKEKMVGTIVPEDLGSPLWKKIRASVRDSKDAVRQGRRPSSDFQHTAWVSCLVTAGATILSRILRAIFIHIGGRASVKAQIPIMSAPMGALMMLGIKIVLSVALILGHQMTRSARDTEG